MPLKLNKAKISLNTNQEVKVPKSIGKMIVSLKEYQDRPIQTKEGTIAFTDEDTTAKYIRLQSKGLNMLRSEIVGISEYIPFATGDLGDTNKNTINYNLGDGKQLSVTNVARLMELHRQIREYVIQTAELVLNKMYPELSKESFVQEVKSIAASNFDNDADEDIQKTFKNITTTLKEQASQNTKDIVNRNTSHPFFLGMIEYIIYENIIEEIIKYIGRVASIDEYLSSAWSIENFYRNESFDQANAFEENALKRAYASAETLLNNEVNIPKSLLSLYRSGLNSDTDMFVNTMAQLASLILLKDSSSVLETSTSLDDGYLEVDPGEIRYGIEGDLEEAISELKQINLRSMFASTKSGLNKEYRTLGLQIDHKPMSYTFLNSVFDKISDAAGDPISNKTTSINELLAALSYDYISFVCSVNNVNSKLKLNKTYGSNNPLLVRSYLSDVLGVPNNIISVDSDDNSIQRSRLPNFNESLPGFGNFGAQIVGVKEKNQSNEASIDNSVFYSPIESTKKEVNKNGKGLIPATQFFIENPIVAAGISNNTNNDIDFSDIDNFTSIYRSLSKSLQSDILTMIPDSQASQNSTKSMTNYSYLKNNSTVTYLQDMNNALADDLKAILEDYDDRQVSKIPLLSIFLSDLPPDKLTKLFASMFWGAVFDVGSQQKNKDNERSIINREDLRNTPTEKVFETIAAFVQYYCEDLADYFLKDICNINYRNGGVGRRKFHNSGVRFKVVLAEDGDLTNRDGVKGAINQGKYLNGLVEDRSNPNRQIKMSHNRLDNVFSQTFAYATNNPKSSRLRNIRNYDRGTSADYSKYGFYILFSNSIKKIILGENRNLSEALGKRGSIPYRTASGEERINSFFVRDENKSDKIRGNRNPSKTGSIVQFSAVQRSLIWFSYIHNLLKSTLQAKAKTDNNGGLSLGVHSNQIKAVIAALRGNSLNDLFKPSGGKEAYDTAKNIVDDLYKRVFVRQTRIRDCASLFNIHANALEKSKSYALNTIEGSVSSLGRKVIPKKTSLAISSLKKLNIYEDSLTLNSDNAVNLMLASFQKNYETEGGSLFPKDIRFLAKKNRFVGKVLSEQGYGFLKSEKRGSKSILNVGITNSMISSLRLNAFQETDDIRYLDSNFICISVYKKSHFYPEYSFFPKNFVFDVGANILDYNPRKLELSSHLKDFRDDMTFNQLLNSVEVSRIFINEKGRLIKSVKKGYGKRSDRNKVRTGKAFKNKDLLINHLFDYALKEYSKLTTGLSFDEDSFLLLPEPINFNMISESSLGSNMSDEYLRILEHLSKLYPNTETDSQLKSEVFRLTKILKQSLPFSFENRVKKVVAPKTFDKVYSVLVNEKDFILDSSFKIFDDPISHYITSKLQRPDKVSRTYENLINLRDSAGVSQVKDSQILKYARSINENFPEVYNYSVAVSLLPDDFDK